MPRNVRKKITEFYPVQNVSLALFDTVNSNVDAPVWRMTFFIRVMIITEMNDDHNNK